MPDGQPSAWDNCDDRLLSHANREEGDEGVLHREHAFSDMFVAYLLTRNIRYEEDLADEAFQPSEKRLARVLLLLAHFGKEGKPEIAIPTISQETRRDGVQLAHGSAFS